MEWWQVAAVFIPFLLFGSTIVFLADKAGVFSDIQYAEIVVPCGERMQVVLQDGTNVELNSATTLRYPKKFGLFSRKVELYGEGYFKVAKEREYHCFENLYNEMKVNEQDFKKIEILISLFIGSINDASSISLQPEINLLDKIKNKVLLFDTDQTRFIYDNVSLQKKSIRIQGLSGTGKTELLLHKLKDLYLNDEEVGYVLHVIIMC